MTSPPPPRPSRVRPARAPRRRRVLAPLILTVVVLLILVSAAASIGTRVLWFRQLGFAGVYGTQMAARVLLFVVGALAMAVPVAVSMSIAHRTRPLYVPVTTSAQNLDRYRENLEPLRRVVTVALPAVLGLFAGSAVASRWPEVLLWWHRTPFHTADPVFHHDLAFYVFTVPFLRLVLGLVTAVLVLAALAGAATHYLYGGLRFSGPGPRTSRAARVHLAIMAALLVLAQAAAYWLDRYATLTGRHQRFDGANYTDLHVTIPARGTLALIAVVCAALFVVAAFRGGWRVPFAGLALLVVSYIVIGGLAPTLVQHFKVDPSEAQLESTNIGRNIQATRTAFGVEKVASRRYDPSTSAEVGALAEDAQTTASIRILDPYIVSPTFQQLEQNKPFYRFPDTLDVDRYTVDGRSQDTVLAARELDLSRLPSNSTSWINEHTVYTHGYGLVAAAGNKQGADGIPDFIEQGIPTSGQLGDFQPRIYFGESFAAGSYSVVGAPAGSKPAELDYPDDAGSSSEKLNTYTGDGGPKIGSLWRKLLYAVSFRDPNLLLSDAVNPDSQILYDRSPRERVAQVAPYLTLDGDPYPAVVDGRIVWIVDGYTTTRDYPYAQAQRLDTATADRLTEAASNTVALPATDVNYLRNSVKATVDAYSGKVSLYAWDASDPVLKSWESIFPGTIQPASRMSAQLMAHVRYPEDLFKVQRSILGSYHVTDPGAFYKSQDFWQTPQDPTTSGASTAEQPAYYLTLKMPGQSTPTYSLSTSYIPFTAGRSGSRDVLTGFLAVDSDAGSSAGVRRADYGTLRLLQLPTDAGIAGPGQVQNNFTTNSDVSTELNLLSRGGTKVRYGNLLTLPVGGGLLYVEPVYVQSSGSTSYPLLRRVLVSFGGQVGFADTLDKALDQVFGGNSGANAGDAGSGTASPTPSPTSGPSPGPSSSPTASPSPPPTGGSGSSAALTQALSDAEAAYTSGQQALARGDFAAYGQAQQQLQQALQRAVAAERARDGGAAPTATATATPSPSPTG